jgi:alpha-beta hydrolase superfamily lysophospholipase
LALYGAHDMLVPKDAMARAWSRMPATVRKAFYPDGYHLLLRDKDRAAPTEDVIGWILHPTMWLPSGADLAAAAWEAGRP